MLEPDVVERIRTIFLHQRPHVSIAEGTVLLGWSREEMSEAIRTGEVEVNRTPVGTWLWREELMAKALDVWPLEAIEEALGDDAGRVLPPSIRLVELHVRIPRHHAAMLEYLAERERASVSAVLTRELDGVASGYAEELSWAITGFETALQWPDSERGQSPC